MAQHGSSGFAFSGMGIMTYCRITLGGESRQRLWREDYSHFERDLDAMMDRLRHLRPLIGGEEFARWQSLAAEERAPELFQRIMEAHYDPAYARSIRRNYPNIDEAARVDLSRLDRESLLEAARQLRNGPATV